MKIALILNSAWNIVNFRSGLITELVKDGHDVVAIAPSDEYVDQLIRLGCKFIHLPMNSAGTSPLQDIKLLLGYIKIFNLERPEIVLCFTIKPNIYGSIAARILGISVVNNIAGLGVIFKKKGILQNIVLWMYRFALQKSSKIFFQNREDRNLFEKKKIINPKKADVLPGSGICLITFPREPLPENSVITFLMACRIIWEKGILEYVQAIRILQESGIQVRALLCGFFVAGARNGVPKGKISAWQDEGLITFLGRTDAMADQIKRSDCVVLPSYYPEGTPRFLLEGAAMSRPLITTDTPGCRDVVVHGSNGYLCRPRDPRDLAAKMAKMVALTNGERRLMGERSRELVSRGFSENIVVDRYLRVIRDVGDTLGL